jgi:integrase
MADIWFTSDFNFGHFNIIRYCIVRLRTRKRWMSGCAQRRAELAALTMEDIQQREGRWVIADLCGKGVGVNTYPLRDVKY